MPTDTWVCPAGVTSVFVECWGSGNHAGHQGQYGGFGGGGGAYARRLVPVVPSTGYDVEWRLGGSGFATDFGVGLGPLVRGVSANPLATSTPGVAADCIGDFKFSGAYGGGGVNQASAPPNGPNGGGGGGSGGRASDGNAGTPGIYQTVGGGIGGVAVVGGGGGGNGGIGDDDNSSDGNGPGLDGTAPGSGGGGAGWAWANTPGVADGFGQDGGILIWNATGGGSFANTILNPSNLVGSYGAFPAPPPPPAPAKLRKRAFMM